MEEFQSHAQRAAQIAGTFALPKYLADSAVVGALLHDVGKLVLAARMPQRFREVLRAAEERHEPLHRVEVELYGISHAEIGAYLLGLWGLPTFVTEAVAHHHAPMRVPHHGLDALSVVYLSNVLAHQVELSSPGPLFEPVNEDLLQALGASGQYPVWQQKAHQVTSALAEKLHAHG